MKKLIYIFVFFLSYVAYSQSLSVFNVDASGFPKIKANFYAFDAIGNQLTNLSTIDFEVTENGLQRNVTTLTCPSPKPPIALSSVLVVDVSGSMGYNMGGFINLDLAKEAASAWVNGLPLGKSECAITSFNTQNYFNRDFTTDRNSLLTAISRFGANGGTNYEAALINPVAGGILAVQRGKYKKVIVFLTDGQPNFPPNESLIISEAKKNNITIYCVSLNMPIPDCMKHFAEQTGGQWFGNVTTVTEAKSIYQKILQVAQGIDPCTIEWNSELTCIEGTKQVKVLLKQYSVFEETSYLSPQSSIAKIEVNPISIYFKNKIPNGTKYDTTITVTAKNTDVNVTNIIPSNPLFSVAPTSFTLASGQNRILTVSFTPTDSSYQYSKFTIQNDICESNFYASGGFKDKKAKVPTLKLTHPNGGEVFVVGTDTVMTWEGVLPTDTVNLEYSIDNGKNWIFLTDKATNLKWVWKNVPKPPSNICLGRVSIGGNLGGIFAWGNNQNGQLGDGTYTNCNIPKLIDNSSDWSKIEAGNLHSVSIKKDNTLWAWGWNSSGQLGDGTQTQRNSMKQVGKDNDWKIVASGGQQNIAIKSDGTLWTWGDNYEGQLGDGTKTLKTQPIQIGTDNTWQTVSSGWAHSMAIKKDGSLWAWGRNSQGQLGDGTTTLKLTPIRIGTDNDWSSAVCSDVHTLGLKNDGTIWAWGCNTYGQLGDGTTVQRNAPIQVGNDNDWSFIALGTGDYGKSHSIAIKRDGTLWVWGYNSNGQIGDGTTTQRNIPTKVGNDNDWYCVGMGCYHTVAIKRDGSLWAWGKNEFGQLGDGTNIDKHTPLRIENSNNWDTVVCGNHHTLALKYGASGQSDVSDAVWSIVMPEVVSKDIDMKKCLVGSMKDSVVTPFISNTGTYKCRIDSIYFTGADAGAFSLIAGIPEYYINSGENKFAEFRFKPTRVGLHSAKIKIITQADTLTQNIIGEGVKQTIEVVGNFIDFGKVGVGLSKDTIQALTIKNIGTIPIQITKTNHNKPNDYDFTKGNSAGFTLAPNEIKKMDLRFTPSELGRTSGLLEFHYAGVGSPAVVQLFGEGIGGKVIIENDSAYPGEKRFLRLRLGNEIKPSAQTGVTQFRVKLSYNPTILTMLDSKAVKTFDLIKETVEITRPWDNVAELLGEFEVEAGLGNADFTDLVIEEFNWLDAQGNVVDFGTEKQNGTFKLLGICYEGGARLVNPNGIAGIMQIKPNPASEDIEIGINLIEKGYSIVSIYNSNGEKMKEYNMTGKKGLQTINLDISEFSNGLYFVQLLTPTIFKNQKLMIIK